MGGEVKEVKMGDADSLVDHVVVLWRNEVKQPARVLSIDKAQQRAKYELLTGPDKGKKFSSRYDTSQTVKVYDGDSEILALCDA
jgi:hypothetical protein